MKTQSCLMVKVKIKLILLMRGREITKKRRNKIFSTESKKTSLRRMKQLKTVKVLKLMSMEEDVSAEIRPNSIL
jgi:hypothetical protein